MKKIFYILTILAFGYSQAQPQKVNYQAVALTAGGQTVKNQAIKLRLSIVDSSATGTVLYTETHQPTTDGAGQFSVFLGGGTSTLGTFSSVPWSNGKDKFLKAEADVTGGNNYVLMGTSQMVSVPYAISAGSLKEGATITGANGSQYTLNVGASGPIWTCYPPVLLANAGPDQLSITGTTVNLAANSPTAGETGTWNILNGNGGSLSANNNPSATFTKGTDSAYTFVWTITGPCGTSLDTVNLSFQNLVMNIPCSGIAIISYAGESYPTVQIGNQCWMAKNLNVGTYVFGGGSQANNNIIEKFCYDNQLYYCISYGGLYQWAEAVQYQNGASNSTSTSPSFSGNVMGICPTGWHIPSDAEWNILETNLGGSSVAGGAMKTTFSALWASPNRGATNSSGFSAKPGAHRSTNGTFFGAGFFTKFWSSTESSLNTSVNRYLVYSTSNIARNNDNKFNGFSVRCLKD